MAAEIRVDTIKNRSGINTVAFAESTHNVVILGSVGIGTTSVPNTVTTANNAKVAVGIISCQNLYSAGTSHFKIPAGTTGQRPGSPEVGTTRYNTTPSVNYVETWNGSAWINAAGNVASIDTDQVEALAYVYNLILD